VTAAVTFLYAEAGEKVDKQRPTQVGRALRSWGADDSGLFPQARGRSERSFGLARRLPQELRLAEIETVEEANRFSGALHREFNAKFTVAAAQKGTAFRRSSRTIWTGSSRCRPSGSAKDNTVAIAERSWQLIRAASEHAGCATVTSTSTWMQGIDSLGPHTVGRFDALGKALNHRRSGTCA